MLKFYIPSGEGPTLEDFFGHSGALKTKFLLTGLGQGFDWTYTFFNEDPVDDVFKTYLNGRKIDVHAQLNCGKAGLFVDCYLN